MWIDGKQGVTSGANKVYAKMYDKTLFNGIEQPPVYYVVNADKVNINSSTPQRKHYFPPSVAKIEIDN